MSEKLPATSNQLESDPQQWHPLVEVSRITDESNPDFGKTRIDSPLAADITTKAAHRADLKFNSDKLDEESARKGLEYRQEQARITGEPLREGQSLHETNLDILNRGREFDEYSEELADNGSLDPRSAIFKAQREISTERETKDNIERPYTKRPVLKGILKSILSGYPAYQEIRSLTPDGRDNSLTREQLDTVHDESHDAAKNSLAFDEHVIKTKRQRQE